MTGSVVARLIGWALASAVVAAAGTALVLRAALAGGILDVPNHRSSHTTPTPRGGGVAIVAVVITGEILLAVLGWLSPSRAIALVLSGAAVAAIGAWDDLRTVSPGARLAVHLAAAAAALAILTPEKVLPGHAAWGLPEWLLTLACLLAIVWLTNLYNFMDGIDGIAGTQAVVAGSAAALTFAASQPALALVACIVAGAAAGFLILNWPPARIFMGDVGSGFLGMTFGVLIAASSPPRTLIPLAALAPFIIDATVTLVVRSVRREQITAAHRSHLYQRLVQRGWSHRRVTVVYGVASVICAGLMAAVVGR